jgi:hypothetical protein
MNVVNKTPIKLYPTFFYSEPKDGQKADIVAELNGWEGQTYSFEVPSVNWRLYFCINPSVPVYNWSILNPVIFWTFYDKILDPAKDYWDAATASKLLRSAMVSAGDFNDAAARYRAAIKEWTDGQSDDVTAAKALNDAWAAMQTKVNEIISTIAEAQKHYEAIPISPEPFPRASVLEVLRSSGIQVSGLGAPDSLIPTPAQVMKQGRLGAQITLEKKVEQLAKTQKALADLEAQQKQWEQDVKNIVTDFNTQKAALIATIAKSKATEAAKVDAYNAGILRLRIIALAKLGFTVDHATGKVTGTDTAGLAARIYNASSQWTALKDQLAALQPKTEHETQVMMLQQIVKKGGPTAEQLSRKLDLTREAGTVSQRMGEIATKLLPAEKDQKKRAALVAELQGLQKRAADISRELAGLGY